MLVSNQGRRILHVTQSGGGVANVIKTLICSMKDFEHVIVAPEHTFSEDQTLKMNIRIISIPMVRNLDLLRDFISFMRLLRVINQENFDLVHLHSSKAGFLGRIALRLSSKRDTPLIYTPHGWAFHENMSRIKYAFFSFLERATSSLADWVVCVSESEREQAQSESIRPKNCVLKIYNGMDLSSFHVPKDFNKEVFRTSIGIATDAKVFLFNARLAEQKSPLEVLEAFRMVKFDYPDAVLLMVGDGPLYDAVRAKRGEYHLQNDVKLVGWVEDVREYLWCSDVALHISKWEAFGLSIIETMAAGLPVIATNIGAIPEVTAGAGVKLVDNHRPREIYESMTQLLKNTPGDKCMLLNRAALFNETRMVNSYRRLYYLEIIERRN